MSGFNPLEYHPLDYFEQNMIRLNWTSLSDAPKERKSGFVGFLYKIWRRLSRWDLQPSSIQSRMVEIAQNVLASKDEPESQKLTKLSNLYGNIVNFERAVTQKHNNSPLSYILFWTYMPRPPKRIMDGVECLIMTQLDNNLKEDRASLKELLGVKESLNRIRAVKNLRQAVETIAHVKRIDPQKIQDLKEKCDTIPCEEISSLNQLAGCLKERFDNNKWTDDEAREFRVLQDTVCGGTLERIARELPEGTKKNAAEQHIEKIKTIVAETRAKIDVDQKALDNAVQEILSIMNNSSLADLPRLINPGIPLDDYRYWSGRTYLPQSSKESLQHLIDELEKAVPFLSQSSSILNRMHGLEQSIFQQSPKNFVDYEVRITDSSYNKGFCTIEGELEGVLKEIVGLKNRLSGFSKIATGLLTNYLILSRHLREAWQVMQLLQTANHLSCSFCDKRLIARILKKNFPGEFNESKPFASQYQTLIVDPVKQYLEKLAHEGKGDSIYAQEAANLLDRFTKVKDAYLKGGGLLV